MGGKYGWSPMAPAASLGGMGTMLGVGPTNARCGKNIAAASATWRGCLFVYCCCDMAMFEEETRCGRENSGANYTTAPIAEAMNQHTVFLYAECGDTAPQFQWVCEAVCKQLQRLKSKLR
jgi:hypothetical protein